MSILSYMSIFYPNKYLLLFLGILCVDFYNKFIKVKSTGLTASIKAFLATGAMILIVSSCSTERKVCPAYQSAFIFDTTALKKKFSLFVNDTPRIYEVSKNKFLIIEPMSYREKMASFRTIEMLPIYPVIPDSLKFSGDQEMKAEMDVVDSTAIDSLNIHPGLIGPFNVEQENYMYIFRKYLVLPDRRESESTEEADIKGKKKSPFAFLKNLFKKQESDSSETESEVIQNEEPKKRSGLFNRLEGSRKEDLKDSEKEKNSEKEEQTDEDGF